MRKILVILTLISLLIPYSGVFAETEFNPHYIISDDDLQNCSGWTSVEIQKFLDSKGSYLASYRGEDLNGEIKTAAEIIYDSALRNQISPKFLLVTLQKEQSLITDNAPTQKQLDWATGFAVCDGCYLNDPKVLKYKGFGKQVDGAAGIMRWYYDNKLSQPFIKKKDTFVYIDDQPVTPQNWATAFLYTYTPHLHGNKNFWRIWNMWFAQFYPNGTLVKTASTSEYFLIWNGTKRSFKTNTALITRTDPKLAVLMSEADLMNYPEGPAISFPNYSVLKAPSGYYLTDYDYIRPFESDEVVRKLGYNPQEVIEVTQEDLAQYTRGTVITASSASPQGVIWKITDLKNSLYLFKDSILYPIADSNIAKTNFSNLAIENKRKIDMEKYQVADLPIYFADGSLIKIKDSNKLYVIDQGKKRRIADEETFLAMGYQKSNLIETAAPIALNIPEGEPIYVNNALASSNNKFLGDNEGAIDDLFKTKLPSYLVAEYPSGKIIAGKNIDTKRPIASIVKLLTAYEALNQDFNLTKSTSYSSSAHQSYGNPFNLVSGEKIKNKDLLYSLLIASVNNTARMIASASGMNENTFIKSINSRLEQWGADDTTIEDVTGLSAKNLSTPRDVLKIFFKSLGNTTIRDALSKSNYTFKEVLNKNKISSHSIKSTNNLVFKNKANYNIIASKTGYTDEAGAILVMLIQPKKNNKQYVVITMGNSDYANRFNEPNRLAEWVSLNLPAASIASAN